MPSYHFSVGDSADGHIGLCARVDADTKEEAVVAVKAVIEEFVREFRLKFLSKGTFAEHGVEYFNVYLNPDKFTVEDIDEIDDGEPA